MNYFTGKNGVYIIAEIGGNHEGNFEYAKELTRLAASSGADAVKFQIYTGDTLVNPVLASDRNKHFKKFQLAPDQYIELAKLCRELGTTFMASVWDPAALEYIDPFIEIYKIGSGDLTAYSVIQATMRFGKPIILSTGLADMAEVLHTVEFIRSVAPAYIEEKKLALLQCTAMYPIPDQDANLHVMDTLHSQTGLPVGYSDHTVGMVAVETAVAMGAQIIEMHFTDTREGKEFRDHKVSATREEIEALILRIQKIRTLQGSHEKNPTPSELENKHPHSFRRGIYPARDIAAGTVISADDLVALRPCLGIGAEKFYRLVGMKARQNLKKYQELSFSLFE